MWCKQNAKNLKPSFGVLFCKERKSGNIIGWYVCQIKYVQTLRLLAQAPPTLEVSLGSAPLERQQCRPSRT